ncbi:hypothetical protein KM043_018528 [Ampulex compressa]|nr:hypothetical protein KM043_018528 [Ampulex compressa]
MLRMLLLTGCRPICYADYTFVLAQGLGLKKASKLTTHCVALVVRAPGPIRKPYQGTGVVFYASGNRPLAEALPCGSGCCCSSTMDNEILGFGYRPQLALSRAFSCGSCQCK